MQMEVEVNMQIDVQLDVEVDIVDAVDVQAQSVAVKLDVDVYVDVDVAVYVQMKNTPIILTNTQQKGKQKQIRKVITVLTNVDANENASKELTDLASQQHINTPSSLFIMKIAAKNCGSK